MIEKIELELQDNADKKFAVYECGGEFQIDEIEYNMLRNNAIAGLVTSGMRITNGKGEYLFDITGRVSLQEFLLSRRTRGEMYHLLRSLCLCIERAEKYLLNREHFIVNPEWLFVGESGTEPGILFLPAEGVNKTDITFGEFVVNVLDMMNPDNSFAENFRDKVGDIVERNVQITPRQFYQELISIGSEDEVMQEEKVRDQIREQEELQEKIHSMPVEEARDYGNTSLLALDALEDFSQPEKKDDISDQAYLLHMVDNTRHMIQGEKIVAGRNPKRVDMVLDKPSISGIHMTITDRDGSYYIYDEHSTNGTFINDVRLAENQTKKLNEGDIIKMGVEEYVFYKR